MQRKKEINKERKKKRKKEREREREGESERERERRRERGRESPQHSWLSLPLSPLSRISYSQIFSFEDCINCCFSIN
jgi:hypothetical protein